MPESAFEDLRSFLTACKDVDDWREIEGADWRHEIGALVEAAAELIPEPPLLIFDRIRGYPEGFRVVSLVLTTYRRTALALGLPLDRPRMELSRLAARRVQEVQPLAPAEVSDGPVMENVLTGDQVDVLRFPALHFHAGDAGRFIGTGAALINRDPDTGFVNLGTYRMQVYAPDLLGLWMSPGQHGRLVCQRYWERGESCPVLAAFGLDPLAFIASHTKIPWAAPELDYVGGLRGRPVQVIKGPCTGLPIPVHAEIVIEGEVPPPSVEAREEGPFGEWRGYSSGGTLTTGELQPVLRVKAIYHRTHPILWDEAPMWPGAPRRHLRIDSGLLWDQLEKAGVQDVVGVHQYNSYFVAVAIRQRYPGHARQAGLAASSCAASARDGRYVVIVDEDIDPSDIKEVLWAMETRVDPVRDIQVVDGSWSTPLDARMPPEKQLRGDHTNSRAIILAVRPYAWKERFPQVSRTEPDQRRAVVDKFRHLLPFPPL